MQILSTTPKLPQFVLGQSLDAWPEETPFFADARGYLWSALSAPQEPVAQGQRAYRCCWPQEDFWKMLIFEAFAPSSQWDRLLFRPPARSLGPVLALALDGLGFHGQFGRKWHSRHGNIHLCAALPLPAGLLPESRAAQLMILPSLALREALRSLLPSTVSIASKWPNDIVIEGQKVAGALAAFQAEAGYLRQIFLGLGINLASAPVAQANFAARACACADFLDPSSDVLSHFAPLFWALARALESKLKLWIEAPEEAYACYLAHESSLGREVLLSAPLPPHDNIVRGRVGQIDPSLGLWIDGHRRPFYGLRLHILA